MKNFFNKKVFIMKGMLMFFMMMIILPQGIFAQAPYCSVTGGTSSEPITIVQFSNLNLTFPTATGGGAYVDNTASVATTTAGTMYNLVVGGNSDGNYTNHFRVYIDWNNDNDLVDAGEGFYIGSITNSTGLPGSPTTSIMITVPAAQAAGNYRMRIVKTFATGTAIGDPCVIGSTYGQARDRKSTRLNSSH